MAHTAGPWEPMMDGPKRDRKPWEPWKAYMEAAPGLTIGCPSNTEPICRVSGYLMPVVANARLISAAPELLEAVKGLERRAFDAAVNSIPEAHVTLRQELETLCFQARAAITKAEG